PSTEVRIPFVEELLLERVKVRFQLEADEPTHEFSIARLQAGMDAEDRLSLEGTGELNQEPLTLVARLGNIEQFLSATDPSRCRPRCAHRAGVWRSARPARWLTPRA
ncbi:MAG: hypothetical protein O7F08_07440, partial [Deltaproteobacteria bacterium]|nr:hypothetical protein [Deltaproteobacteria bacterium]